MTLQARPRASSRRSTVTSTSTATRSPIARSAGCAPEGRVLHARLGARQVREATRRTTEKYKEVVDRLQAARCRAPATDAVPQPDRRRGPRRCAQFGIVSIGGCDGAVARGRSGSGTPRTASPSTYMRIRAYPFPDSRWRRSSASTTHNYVIEQNRDGQLHRLLLHRHGYRAKRPDHERRRLRRPPAERGRRHRGRPKGERQRQGPQGQHGPAPEGQGSPGMSYIAKPSVRHKLASRRTPSA